MLLPQLSISAPGTVPWLPGPLWAIHRYFLLEDLWRLIPVRNLQKPFSLLYNPIQISEMFRKQFEFAISTILVMLLPYGSSNKKTQTFNGFLETLNEKKMEGERKCLYFIILYRLAFSFSTNTWYTVLNAWSFEMRACWPCAKHFMWIISSNSCNSLRQLLSLLSIKLGGKSLINCPDVIQWSELLKLVTEYLLSTYSVLCQLGQVCLIWQLQYRVSSSPMLLPKDAVMMGTSGFLTGW